MPAEVEDCRRRIEALETEQGIIDREAARRRRGRRRAATEVDEKLGRRARAPGRAREALGGGEGRSSTRCSSCARSCAATTSRSIGRPPASRRQPRPRSRRRGAGRDGRRRPRQAARRAARRAGEARRAAGRVAADPAVGRRPGGRHASSPTGPASRSAGWSRTRSQAVLKLGETLGQRVIGQQHGLEMIARRIQTSRARLDNPNKPIGVFMLCGTSGRRQDRDRAGARRGALRRRAERHHHQHERVPGGAHRLDAQGRAARLRRLRRGRRPDRGGAAPALQRGAARRGREGAPGRARDLLPGLRQGLDGGRRGPRYRLQEHDHPADLERRHRPDHEHVQGPGPAARPRVAGARR